MFARNNRALCIAGLALLVLPAAGAACTISASSMVFGLYNPLGSSSLETVGDIEVICTEFTSYTLSLSSGQNGFTPRKLQSATSASLEYNLFTDATYQIIWGDNTQGTSRVSGSADATGNQHNIYGRIPGGQNVPAGHYADDIIITIEY